MERQSYLEDISLEQATERFFSTLEKAGLLTPMPAEDAPLDQAVGRTTAGPVWARISAPHYHAAAMDGAAVRAEDTHGAARTSPVRLKLGPQAKWVDTGDAMPPEFNAVIMAEDIQQIGEDEIEIMASVAPWQHVRPLGEDMVASELVLPAAHVIRPVDLGALAAAGLTSVAVRRKPKVAIIPTGTELIPLGQPAEPGRIIEFNTLILAGLVAEWGGLPTRWPIVPDDQQKLLEAVERAAEGHDIVIVNAGSSAGSEDFTARTVAKLGQLLVHGIAIRPGHPVILGIAKGKPAIGLPGYPVAATLTLELLVQPLIYRLLGGVPPKRPTARAVMTRKVLSPMGQEEFLRVKLGSVGGKLVATPLSRGAGVVTSLVKADGMVRIPRFSEGILAGAVVDVELFRRPEELGNTIVAIGSHDLTLDVLASMLRERRPELTLSSSNVGSLGGLIALKRGEAHLAGSHLLDEATGEYNVSYIRQTLPGQDVVLMNLTYREQGLMVRKGNPKSIRSLEDLAPGSDRGLARKDVLYVNRQRGSGTRVLLDYELKRRGLDASAIRGYEREEFTHTAVAATVASGAADAALGILAAARALGLDFVPLLKERYDLVIPRAYYESPLLQPLLELIRSEEFQRQVQALGGYDTSETGKVLVEIKG
ncbi:MAG: molybdopterin biosynthesis protein [Chloroflexota bacterium]|nr:molybdopterin biosynthesis protein [Chloroflexota bacterium]